MNERKVKHHFDIKHIDPARLKYHPSLPTLKVPVFVDCELPQ
jgi:hypothetical protein